MKCPSGIRKWYGWGKQEFSNRNNSIKSYLISIVQRIRKYYGTYRPKDFEHDHWRKELDVKILTDIMENTQCQKVLKLLGYVDPNPINLQMIFKSSRYSGNV